MEGRSTCAAQQVGAVAAAKGSGRASNTFERLLKPESKEEQKRKAEERKKEKNNSQSGGRRQTRGPRISATGGR